MYSDNILEMIKSDHQTCEMEHYNQIVQCLSQFTMLSDVMLKNQEQQMNQIQQINGIKYELEQQVNNDKMVITELESDATRFK